MRSKSSGQQRAWIDENMFTWYTYGGQEKASRSPTFVNRNGEQKPRKVTFIDSSPVAVEGEARRSTFHDGIDNIKRLFGRLTEWLAEVPEMSVRRSFQAIVDKVAFRFSSSSTTAPNLPPDRETQDDEPPTLIPISQYDSPPGRLNQGQAARHEHRVSFNSTMNSSSKTVQESGRHGIMDRQNLKDWFIRCIRNQKNSSRLDPDSKSSLERQVSLVMSGCFRDFGSLNDSYSPNVVKAKGDLKFNTSNNNNISGSESTGSSDAEKKKAAERKTGRRVSKSPPRKRFHNKLEASSSKQTGIVERGRNKSPEYRNVPLICTLDQAEGKDVSQLIKMFDSYSLLENAHNKISLTEKFSNVNVRNIIKQLDLILLQECAKNQTPKISPYDSQTQCKIDLALAEDEVLCSKSGGFPQEKDRRDKQVNRLTHLRDLIKKALGLSPLVRNRSSTLPPNRMARLMVPVRDQLKNITSRRSWTPDVKTVNVSRNNLDPYETKKEKSKGPSNLKVLSMINFDRRKQTTATCRSKSAQPQVVLPSTRNRQRGKTNKKTEDSFKFLMDKLLVDQPKSRIEPFPYGSRRKMRELQEDDGEDKEGGMEMAADRIDSAKATEESMWEKIHSWEMKAKVDDPQTAKISKEQTPCAESLPFGLNKRSFGMTPSCNENSNSSSSATFGTVSALTRRGSPHSEGKWTKKNPTIHRSSWLLHQSKHGAKANSCDDRTAGFSKENAKGFSSRYTVKRNSSNFEAAKENLRCGYYRDLKNKNDRCVEPSSTGARKCFKHPSPSPRPSKSNPAKEQHERLRPVPRPRHTTGQGRPFHDPQKRVKRPPLQVNSGVVLAFDRVVEQLKYKKVQRRRDDVNSITLSRHLCQRKEAGGVRGGSGKSRSSGSSQLSPRKVKSLVKIFEKNCKRTVREGRTTAR